jgi:hypothetical protein
LIISYFARIHTTFGIPFLTVFAPAMVTKKPTDAGSKRLQKVVLNLDILLTVLRVLCAAGSEDLQWTAR